MQFEGQPRRIVRHFKALKKPAGIGIVAIATGGNGLLVPALDQTDGAVFALKDPTFQAITKVTIGQRP